MDKQQEGQGAIWLVDDDSGPQEDEVIEVSAS